MFGIIGGFMMLAAGVTGAATWGNLGFVAVELTGIEALWIPFLILMILGSLGGLLVIFGAWLIMTKGTMRRKNRVRLGKTLISIGAGFGLIGLVILIIVSLVGNNFAQLILGANLGFIGLVLTIIARKKARK